MPILVHRSSFVFVIFSARHNMDMACKVSTLFIHLRCLYIFEILIIDFLVRGIYGNITGWGAILLSDLKRYIFLNGFFSQRGVADLEISS